jgi:hypothetical protein
MVRENQRLYLMENDHQLNKIGIAINPVKRQRQLELASGTHIKIIRCWQTTDARAIDVEKGLHSLFSRRRVQGEWFTHISIPDIEYAGYELTQCNNDGSIRRRYESI